MRRLALLSMLLVSPALLASDYSDLYLIPAAGHVSGVNGSSWMSDVAIQNPQSTALSVQLVLIGSGEGMPDNITALGSVTVPANGTRILRDVMNGMPQSTGAILIGADRPFALSSRTYIADASGGTQGQSVTPMLDFVDNSLTPADLSSATAYVAGLTSNSHYRTNLGFVAGNGGSSGMTVEISLRDADGTTLGTKMFTVPGSAFEHVQISSTTITSKSFDQASATFRIVSGSGTLAPYASVVDNMSNGAFFISSQFPPNAPFVHSASLFRSLLLGAAR